MNRKLKNEELNRLSVSEFKEAKKIPLVIILDNIRSLSNIGSIFRTSDAFLVEEIILCGITAQPPHREIQKTALGATETVKWSHNKSVEDAITKLKNDNYIVCSVEQTSDSVDLNSFKIDANKKYALILGNEVSGVSEAAINLSNYCVELEQHGSKHSLNVSVCGSIYIWEFYKKLY